MCRDVMSICINGSGGADKLNVDQDMIMKLPIRKS